MSRTVTVALKANTQQYDAPMTKSAAVTRGLRDDVSKMSTSSQRELHALGKAGSAQSAATSKAGAETSGALSRMTQSAGMMKAGFVAAGALAGTAIIRFASASVAATSDLNEQVSATKTIFGEASDAVLKFGQDAHTIGLSERAALEASNAFGDFFVKIGYTDRAAGTLSESLVRMAADFASFKNLEPGDVLLKLKSGLAGESEPLRSLGVFLNEAAVKAEGMKLGLAGAHGEMTEGQKITARYKLIIESMGDAYGDVSRTANSYANQQRRFGAETENLKANLGRGLLPVLTDLSVVANRLAGALNHASESTDDSNGSWLDSVPIVGAWAAGLHKAAGQSKDTAGAVNYLTDAEKILAHSQDYTKEQVQQATQSLEAQKAALDALLQATQAQFSSEIAGQRAVVGLRDSLRDLNGAIAANKDSKRDNNVSTDDMTLKQLAVKDALLQVADAAVRTASDQAAAAGQTLTESEKYDAFRGRLIQLRDQFPQLRTQIDAYIKRLGDTPSTVPTNVALTGVPAATAKLNELNGALNVLNGKSVTADVRVAVHAPGFVGPTVAEGLAKQGHTGPYTPKQRGQTHATGGWVTGPGTGTSDDVPISASNGEFVVKASAAAAHAPLLEAINSGTFTQPTAYATGGWVGASSTPATVVRVGLSERDVQRLEQALTTARHGFRDLVIPAGAAPTSRELVDEAVFAYRTGRLD